MLDHARTAAQGSHKAVQLQDGRGVFREYRRLSIDGGRCTWGSRPDPDPRKSPCSVLLGSQERGICPKEAGRAYQCARMLINYSITSNLGFTAASTTPLLLLSSPLVTAFSTRATRQRIQNGVIRPRQLHPRPLTMLPSCTVAVPPDPT